MEKKALPTIVPEIFEDEFNHALDNIPRLSPVEIRDMLFESKQSTLGKAILADLIDIVPIAGDISNIFRCRHAAQTYRERPRRIAKQLIDLSAGLLPDPLGGILDILTPTNTLTYLREEKIGQPPP